MIIDTHTHIGEIIDFLCFDHSLETLLKRMDELKIDAIIQASNKGLNLTEYEKCADESLYYYEKSGHRIFNYFLFDPRYSERCLAVMEKYHDHPAFVAIKIHPTEHHVFGNDPGYRAAWEAARKYGLPIMSHTWALSSYNPNQRYAVPELFEEYIKEYPDVKFVFGHSGGRTDGVRAAAALAKKYDNAYLDIAGDPFEYGVVEYLANHAGSHKMVFGSDMFWFDPSAQLGLVLGADLTDEDKENIFYKTALKVFPRVKI